MKPIPTIAVDLDGTLCKPTPPDKYSTAPPIRENIQKTNELKAKGWRIVIHTSRGWYREEETHHWLRRQGVQYDQLVMGKFVAHAYIDDRNRTFEEMLLVNL